MIINHNKEQKEEEKKALAHINLKMDSKWFGGDPTVIQLTRRAPWDIQLTNGCTKKKRSPETLKCSQSNILRPATSTTCLSVKINRLVRFQHSRPPLFGFRKFQSFRHPCFLCTRFMSPLWAIQLTYRPPCVVQLTGKHPMVIQLTLSSPWVIQLTNTTMSNLVD